MRNYLIFILTFSFISCSTPQTQKISAPIEIVEIKPNRRTHLIKQNLLHLYQIYDLTPVTFTKKIHVQSMVISQSHPTLTLNTRYAADPKKLLAVYLHEQIHWWGELKVDGFEKSIQELKSLFPNLPAQGGSRSVHSTYLHLLVCTLEYQLLVHFLGQKDALPVINELIHQEKIYPWIYTQVLERKDEIMKLVKKYELEPIPFD